MIERTLSAANRAQDVASLSRLLLALLPESYLTVTAEPYKKERTAKQRASLFGVAYASLMPQMGLRGAAEKDELHRFFCCEYWGTKATVFGERIPIRTTTTDERGQRDVISTREQLALYAFIQQRAAEHGFDVPDPDPMWRDRARLDAEDEREASHRKSRKAPGLSQEPSADRAVPIHLA